MSRDGSRIKVFAFFYGKQRICIWKHDSARSAIKTLSKLRCGRIRHPLSHNIHSRLAETFERINSCNRTPHTEWPELENVTAAYSNKANGLHNIRYDWHIRPLKAKYKYGSLCVQVFQIAAWLIKYVPLIWPHDSVNRSRTRTKKDINRRSQQKLFGRFSFIQMVPL